MKLCTFPGQGTPISIHTLRSVISRRPVQCPEGLLKYVYAHPSNPGSIAVSSALFYDIFARGQEQLQQEQQQQRILLGHSLGELTCFWANGLFGIEDLFHIANYRNDLMVKSTKRYLRARGINERFALWALSSPRAKDLPKEVQQLLEELQLSSVSIGNANSVKQCVVTGLVSELESLRIELHLKFLRLKITELTNPDGIPFHNSSVLRPTQEPLYDYMWQKMKANGSNLIMQLNHPILCNLDGQLSTVANRALEKFVRCSSNTVQFTKCYDTINEDAGGGELDEAICMGPGNVVYNLVRRNCQLKAWEFDSLESIEKYEMSHSSNINSNSNNNNT